MRKKILLLTAVLLLVISVAAEKPRYIVLQVDVQSEEDIRILDDVLLPIEEKGWIVTVYVTGDLIRERPDVVADVYMRGHQIGLLGNEGIHHLSLEGKTEQLNSTINLLRDVLAPTDIGNIHFKPTPYDGSYKDDTELLEALRLLNVSSETGFLSVDEDFMCDYCIHAGGIVYPMDLEGITVIPVAGAQLPAGEVPLDDKKIMGELGLSADDFRKLLETELMQDEIKEPRAVIVHPSTIGSSEGLKALTDFLDYVEDNNGRVVLSDKSIAAGIAATYYISYLSASGPGSASPGETVSVSFTYSTTKYCPTFYFKMYGKYPSEADWRPIRSISYYHSTGMFTRSFTAEIPEPPEQTDDTYTIRVVARSCQADFACWPAVNSYEKMDEVEIQIGKPDLNVTSQDIELSTPANRNDSVTITVTVHNEGNVTARNVDVKISKKTPAGREYGQDTQVIASIPAGGSGQATSEWKMSWRGGENSPDFEDVIKVVVDPDNDIKELKENNNDAETYRICGTVKRSNTNALANIWVQIDQKDAGGTWQPHYISFTDKQGDYCYSTNMDFMVEGRAFGPSSRLAWSPTRDPDDIRFKLYPDSQWGSGWVKSPTANMYAKDGPELVMRKDTDFLNKHITYPVLDAINTLDRLINATDYFKGRGMEVKQTIDIEVNNDDRVCKNKSTSCASLDAEQITMWHSHDTTDIVQHEFTHLISWNWGNVYKHVEENWANYGSCIARGSLFYNWVPYSMYLLSTEDTDGDMSIRATNFTNYTVWSFQLAGVYAEVGADDTIGTLKKGGQTIGKDFYYALKDYKGLGVGESWAYKTIFRRHGFSAWFWVPWSYGGLAPPAGAGIANSFVGTFADTLVDSDSDTLADYLNVTAELNVTESGNYTFSGFLYDAANSSYCFANEELTLTAAIQNLSLLFEGTCIFEKQLNGTLLLTFAFLDYENGSNAASFTDGYNLTSRSYTDFDHPGVMFYTGVSSDQGVNNDTDSEYETLSVTVELNISVSDNYTVEGILYDSAGERVDTTTTPITLSAGVTNVSLNFSGQAIYASGANGPYNMTLEAYNIDSQNNDSKVVYSYHSQIVTSGYNYTDFDGSGMAFNSNVTEYTVDENGNSLHDKLILNVSVNATAGTEYDVVGTLKNSSGSTLATASNKTNSSVGNQQVPLVFDGKQIRNATQNGPYSISLELSTETMVTSLGSSSGSVFARYTHTTSAYNYTQFDAYDTEYFNTSYSDSATSDYLNVTLNFTSIASDTYTFSGRLYDADGTLIAQANATSPGSDTLRSVYLMFSGKDVRASGINGPYNLTLLISDSNSNLVAEYYGAHLTAAYNYTQFSRFDVYPNGTYTDEGVDASGDGLYDRLDLNVTLTVDTTGDYGITAWIKDANGTGVALASNNTRLSSGTRVVTLKFDGLEIRNHGKNTTFTLGRLSLYINASGQTIELYGLYTTPSYNYTQFTEGGSVYGKVSYSNGTAAASSLVTITGSSFDSTNTNESGDYNITGLSTKTYTLSAYPPSGENLQKNSTSVYVNGSQATNANLTLYVGGTVSGTVVDDEGAPAENVYVSCLGPSTGFSYTNASGGYTITGLSAGSYNITATPPTSANLNWSVSAFNITAGENATVNFTLKKRGSISGFVFDYNGTLVPYALLYTNEYEAPRFTGYANGSFLMTDMDNGTYTIEAVPPEGTELLNTSATVNVTEGQTTYINFTLPRSGKVVGYVTDQYGDPIANANLSLTFSSTTVTTASTDSNGNYTLTRLGTGTYTVSLDYPTTPENWLILVNDTFKAYDNSVDIQPTANQTVYINFTLRAPSGDWRTQGVVYGNQNCTNEAVTLGGSIIAISGNNLTAVNCTLVVNSSSDGEYGIIVEDGSGMTFENSTIRAENSSNAYTFKAMTGSTLSITDSTIANAGYTMSGSYQSAGIYVGANNAVIERNNITGGYVGVMVYYANNTQINNNTISNSSSQGISAYYSNNNTIRYNILNDSNSHGIYVYEGSNNTVADNTVDNNSGDGIYVYYGASNNVSNNTLRNNSGHGIYVRNSDYCNVSFNTIEGSGGDGLYLYYVDNSRLQNNTISDSYSYGILLQYSTYANLSYNALEDNTDGGFFIVGSSQNYFNHTIDRGNTVNGKQIRYYFGESNQLLSAKYVGHAGIAYSTNITVTGNDITETDGVILYRSAHNNTLSGNQINDTAFGLQVIYSDDNTIAANNIRNSSGDGIYLYHADRNSISENNITQSARDGIYADDSDNNNLTHNTVTDSGADGIDLDNADYTNLVNNTIVNSTIRGLYAVYSDHGNLTANTVHNNTGEGIYISSSTNDTLAANNLSGNDFNLRIYGSSKSQFNHTIDTTNTIGNQSVYYYFNTSGATLDGATAGQIALAYSSFNTITDNTIRNGDGIILYTQNDNNTITGNNVTWSKYGLYLSYSDGNNVSNNFLCGATEYDIYDSGYPGSSGDDNTCSQLYYWSDEGESSSCTTNCTGYTTTTTTTLTTTTINATTTSLPYIVRVDLEDPANNQVDYDGNVFLKYRAAHKASVVNCSVYTNITGSWAVADSDTSIENDRINGFYLNNLANNTIMWNILCADLWENDRFSSLNRILVVKRTAADSANTLVNFTANQSRQVNLTTATNVTLDIVTNATVTGGRVLITSSENTTTNGSFAVPYLNKYISIDASPEIANSLSYAYLKVYYTPAEVAAAGLNETDLALYWYNQTIGSWQELTTSLPWVNDTGVNTTGDYLYANVSHFSEYAIARGESQTSTLQINLQSGWNLMSLPIIL